MSEHFMKQSSNNNFVNTINLIKFGDNFDSNLDKNYSIKIDYNFDEVNEFMNINYYFVGNCSKINFDENFTFQNNAAHRKDNLWKNTCCEIFIKNKDNKNSNNNNYREFYREFNFAFYGAWACYDFTDYRTPAKIANPYFESNIFPIINNDNKHKILNVKIPFAMLLNCNNFDNLTLHFCAVVREFQNDNLYYYADKHLDSSKADFHKF